jgi:Acyltransferase
VTPAVHPLAGVIASFARLISGVQVRWVGCAPEPRQRIYFANHTSHLDFVVLWSALPAGLRAITRPVAAKDYWEKGARAYIALRVFHAVLIERGAAARAEGLAPAHGAGPAVIDQLAEALGSAYSLIFFSRGHARHRRRSCAVSQWSISSRAKATGRSTRACVSRQPESHLAQGRIPACSARELTHFRRANTVR